MARKVPRDPACRQSHPSRQSLKGVSPHPSSAPGESPEPWVLSALSTLCSLPVAAPDAPCWADPTLQSSASAVPGPGQPLQCWDSLDSRGPQRGCSCPSGVALPPGVPWPGSAQPHAPVACRDRHVHADPSSGSWSPGLSLPTCSPGPCLWGPDQPGVGSPSPHSGPPRDAGFIFLIEDNKKCRAILIAASAFVT